MKFAVLGDPHFGEGLHLGKVDPATGKNTALTDVTAAWLWAVKKAVEWGAEGYWELGDHFSTPNPPSSEREEFGKSVSGSKAMGIKWMGYLKGNHDYDRREVHAIADLKHFTDPGTFFWPDEPTTTVLGNILFVSIPHLPRLDKPKFKEMLDLQVSRMDAYVRNLKLRDPKAKVATYLLLHEQIEGVLINEQQRMDDDTIPISWIPLEKFTRVFVGHIHQYQELRDGKILYPGGLHRTDLGEAKETKGFFLVDSDVDSVEFVPFPHPIIRDIHNIHIQLADDSLSYRWNGEEVKLDRPGTVKVPLDFSTKGWKDSIVTVAVEGKRGPISNFPRKALVDFLTSCEIHYIAGGIVMKTIAEDAAESSIGPDVAITLDSLFGEAVLKSGFDKDRQSRVLDLGRSYITQAREKRARK